eukprot:5744210-Amphidinium_carterae.1
MAPTMAPLMATHMTTVLHLREVVVENAKQYVSWLEAGVFICGSQHSSAGLLVSSSVGLCARLSNRIL